MFNITFAIENALLIGGFDTCTCVLVQVYALQATQPPK
jgi:hypothetical protein